MGDLRRLQTKLCAELPMGAQRVNKVRPRYLPRDHKHSRNRLINQRQSCCGDLALFAMIEHLKDVQNAKHVILVECLSPKMSPHVAIPAFTDTNAYV